MEPRLDDSLRAWLSRDAANNNRRLIFTRWLLGALGGYPPA